MLRLFPYIRNLLKLKGILNKTPINEQYFIVQLKLMAKLLNMSVQ